MNSKNRKVSYNFKDAYKELPLAMRVKVIQTANTLLELQRKNGAYLADAREPSLEDGKENEEGGGINMAK